MFKKLSDTLNALVAEYCIDDDAPAAKGKDAAHPADSAAPPDDPPVAPITRGEIIRQAMEIRDAKARELDRLPPAHRRRLRALAEKLMLGESAAPGPESESPPGADGRRTRH